jgi:hypothetical protein
MLGRCKGSERKMAIGRSSEEDRIKYGVRRKDDWFVKLRKELMNRNEGTVLRQE